MHAIDIVETTSRQIDRQTACKHNTSGTVYRWQRHKKKLTVFFELTVQAKNQTQSSTMHHHAKKLKELYKLKQ